jgi:hypothetical protein
MHRFILSIFFVGMLSVSAAAQLQPGSTGGTVGKQDKSISGGEERDRPRAASHPKQSATKSQETSSGSACGRIVGRWLWYLGITETVFDQNGTAHNSGHTGKLTCAGATIRIAWDHGYVDHATVSPDGRSISVVSTWGGGLRFTATRRD